MPVPDSSSGQRASTWELRRYADVSHALHDPRLVVHGDAQRDPEIHRAVRAAAEHALSPARLASWGDGLAEHARLLVDDMPNDVPVDLVAAYAQPWSMEVALLATGASREDANECQQLARQLFLAAAQATDGTPHPDAQAAASELAQRLVRTPARPGAYADVQSFVALTQSLPALLAGAWLELLRHPEALASLIADPRLVTTSIGELLRLGSPSRAVFRVAREAVAIGDFNIQRGDDVALNLWAANRDASHFGDPERLELTRDTAGHLTFGTGVHRCAGAGLVRAAAIIATEALVARNASLARVEGAATVVEWVGGFAMRAPAALVVVRSRRSHAHVVATGRLTIKTVR